MPRWLIYLLLDEIQIYGEVAKNIMLWLCGCFKRDVNSIVSALHSLTYSHVCTASLSFASFYLVACSQIFADFPVFLTKHNYSKLRLTLKCFKLSKIIFSYSPYYNSRLTQMGCPSPTSLSGYNVSECQTIVVLMIF